MLTSFFYRSYRFFLNASHYDLLNLSSDSPLPPIYPAWENFSKDEAKPWKDFLKDRMQLYEDMEKNNDVDNLLSLDN